MVQRTLLNLLRLLLLLLGTEHRWCEDPIESAPFILLLLLLLAEDPIESAPFIIIIIIRDRAPMVRGPY